MSSWVISSNPETYDAKEAFVESNEVDWVTKQNFEVGDLVYIYEVIPPRGRGGIVYKTKVTRTNILFDDKLEDRKHWSGQNYPKNMNQQTRFIRLSLISELNTKELTLESLKAYYFTPPQGLAHVLEKKPRLLSYIQSVFDK
jgi:intein/homing endonuclease